MSNVLYYYLTNLFSYIGLMKKFQTGLSEKHLKTDFPEQRLKDFNPGFIVKYLRNDYEIYSLFYRTFIPPIVGKRFFGTIMKGFNINKMKETDLCTYSDEALALLAFENGYELWSDVWKNSKGTIRHVKKTEKTPDEFMSSKVSKYTTHYNDDGTVNYYYRFWSHAGINRFNVLRGKVRSNRKECPEFFEKFVTEWKNINLSPQEREFFNPTPHAENDYTDITVSSNAVGRGAAENQIGTYEDDDSEGEKNKIEGRKLNMDYV